MLKVEEMTLTDDHVIGTWLVTCNRFHPIWNQWVVSCISLQGHGVSKQDPTKTHEIAVLSINPDHPAKFDAGIGTVHYLMPPDHILQISVSSDANAREDIERVIGLIRNGVLSPDADYRSTWERILGVSQFYIQ